MLCREIIAVCSQIHTKHLNTFCGQNVELLNVKLVVRGAAFQKVNTTLQTTHSSSSDIFYSCSPSTGCPSLLSIVCYIPRPSYPVRPCAQFSIPPLMLSPPPTKLPTAIDIAQFQARTVRGPNGLQPTPKSKYFPKHVFCKHNDVTLVGVLLFGRKQSLKLSSNKDIGTVENTMGT